MYDQSLPKPADAFATARDAQRQHLARQLGRLLAEVWLS
jgi:hypothetical protein